jgi:3-deoxy-7-phosphoheptulonate synthase
MKYHTDNTRIVERIDISSPEEVIKESPITDEVSSLVYGTRNEIANVLHGRDNRIIVVVGPCSIHNKDSALEYAHKLKAERERLSNELIIVMRVYFEKPRTTVGWKGLINDPDINEEYNIQKGIRLARSILLDINELGLPCGTEFLDPISPQYVADLIAWGAIGARTAESQIHRELASGLSCPVGIKNSTSGDLKAAVDGIKASNHPHVFLSTTKEGDVAVFKTSGNNDAHIILRGGKEPNFTAENIAKTTKALDKAGVINAIMVDASHGNSKKVFKNQIGVIEDLHSQITSNSDTSNIKGIMIESNLVEGNQPISENLEYGKSITDACLGWEDTVVCLNKIADAVNKNNGV